MDARIKPGMTTFGRHFWHTGQKNVERVPCTMRLIVPLHFGVGHFVARAVVDAERVLEIAEIAVGLAMIAQRRAAGLIASFSTALMASTSALARARSARRTAVAMVEAMALGRQMRAMQRLAHIDVAEPRDDLLVRQRGLQARLLAARRPRASIAPSNALPSGSGPSASIIGCWSSSSRAISFMKPKRRGSLNVTIAPFDMWNTT